MFTFKCFHTMAHWSTSFSNCALNLPRMKTAKSWKVGWALCTLSACPEGTGTATDSLCMCVRVCFVCDVYKTLLHLSVVCQCMDAHCGLCVWWLTISRLPAVCECRYGHTHSGALYMWAEFAGDGVCARESVFARLCLSARRSGY